LQTLKNFALQLILNKHVHIDLFVGSFACPSLINQVFQVSDEPILLLIKNEHATQHLNEYLLEVLRLPVKLKVTYGRALLFDSSFVALNKSVHFWIMDR